MQNTNEQVSLATIEDTTQDLYQTTKKKLISNLEFFEMDCNISCDCKFRFIFVLDTY